MTDASFALDYDRCVIFRYRSDKYDEVLCQPRPKFNPQMS